MPEPKSPVADGLEKYESVFGAKQKQYLPLPAVVGLSPEYQVISRWELSAEDRAAIANGADVFVSQLTFGDALHPIGVRVLDRKTAGGMILAELGLNPANVPA